MRRLLAFLAAAAALAALGACTTATPRHDAVDAGKVVAVDQWAKREHATVMWVHYPRAADRD
jgi:outer membrane protein assembly factor BamE (lipoprotein component of BamABCDE complex)